MITYDAEITIEKEQYLEDAISTDEFKKWKLGKKVLIHGTTGIGKSYFLLNCIYDSFVKAREAAIKKYPHSDFSNRKILFLTNRVALKEQLIAKYGSSVSDLVIFMNYQELIFRWKFYRDIPKCEMIVADECHFFFSDANFSSDSDIALRYLLEDAKDKLVVYLSATPSSLIGYINEKYPEGYFDYTYKFKRENTISNCYLWAKEDILINKLKCVPKDEKILYFRNNVKKNRMLKEEMTSDVFTVKSICSLNDSKNREYCDKNVLKDLEEKEAFDCNMLISTTVIDNGVSISDSKLKHIVLDNIYDLDIAAQCIGRKRFLDDEELNLYLRIPNEDLLAREIKNVEDILNIVKAFKDNPIDKFCRMYGRDDLHGIVYTDYIDGEIRYIINDIKLYKYIEKRRYLYELLEGDKKTFSEKLFEAIDYNIESRQDLLTEVIKKIKINLLSIKDKKLFNEDKKLINQCINIDGISLFSTGQIKKYNEFFMKYHIPYKVIGEKETGGALKGKRYWKVVFDEYFRGM